jgi:tetratricopeptide (TPR) repeat protein
VDAYFTASSRRLKPRLFSLLLIMLSVLPRLVFAEDTAAAREHFHRASAFFDLGRFDEAAREYEAAYESKNDSALLFNVAQSCRLGGNHAKALQAYRSFLRRDPNAPISSEVRQRIAELESLVEAQRQAATQPPSGTLAPAGTKTAVNGDTSEAASIAPSPSAAARSANIVAPPNPMTKPPRQPLYRKWWLWTAVGVAAAGVIVGVSLAATAPRDASIPSNATLANLH